MYRTEYGTVRVAYFYTPYVLVFVILNVWDCDVVLT